MNAIYKLNVAPLFNFTLSVLQKKLGKFSFSTSGRAKGSSSSLFFFYPFFPIYWELIYPSIFFFLLLSLGSSSFFSSGFLISYSCTILTYFKTFLLIYDFVLGVIFCWTLSFLPFFVLKLKKNKIWRKKKTNSLSFITWCNLNNNIFFRFYFKNRKDVKIEKSKLP